MSRYEFSFVVTEVELSEEVRARVGRAVALAGAEALGSALPDGAVSALLAQDEFVIRHWCGIPAVIELPARVLEPQPSPWVED